VAVLYGDDAATAMGWSPVGVATGAGFAYCAQRCEAMLLIHDPGDLLDARWSPADTELA